MSHPSLCFPSLQLALAFCLMSLFSMCLWFVRVSIRQRRRQMIFEMELHQHQIANTMTEEDFSRLEVLKYVVSANAIV